MPRAISRRVRVLAWLCLVLAIVVRLYWVFKVQSPYDAIYSDMGGYVERAKDLMSHAPSAYPRIRAFYPYGAHYVYAAEFWLCGFENKTVVCVLQALLCASPTYFFVLFCTRFFKSAWGPGLLGLLFAVWQPIVWCVGFFMSETPFLALLFWNAWLCLRFAETRRYGVRLGLTSALLFAIRPQYILTFAIMGALYVLRHRRRLFPRKAWRSYLRVAVPWLAILIFSSARHHRLTGRFGLISENGNLNRVFADTTVAKVEAHWVTPNGEPWFYWFEPPTKKYFGEREHVIIDGYIGDPEVLGRVRKEHLQGKSTFWRVRRAFNNVRLLWDLNDPWPEEDGAHQNAPNRTRHKLQRGFNGVTRWGVIPLMLLGLLLVRKRAGTMIILAHLVTLVVLSMLFFPEARYRVPYDPFMLILASAGVVRLVQIVRRWVYAFGVKRRSAPPSGEAHRAPEPKSA
jgi:hypothetical protein